MKFWKLVLASCFLIMASVAQAWEVGDKAYVYNGRNDSKGTNVFALVEIDDIRGQKAKIIVRAACEDNGWAGKGCNTNWFMSHNIRQQGASGWVSFSELLRSWEDRVR